MNVLARAGLFMSCYSPLFGFFALLQTFGPGWPMGACLGLFGLGVMLTPVLAIAAYRVAAQEYKVDAVQPRDSDAIAYIVTYIVPIAGLAATTGRMKVALLLFVLIVAVLYIRAEAFYVNPYFSLFGYRLFQFVTPSGVTAVLITKHRFVAAKSEIRARRLGEYIYLAVG